MDQKRLFQTVAKAVMAFDLGLDNLPDTEVAEHEGDSGRSWDDS